MDFWSGETYMKEDEVKTEPIYYLGPPIRGIDGMPGRDPATGGVSVLVDPGVPLVATIDPVTGVQTISHQTTTVSDGTIFGLSPLMLGVIAIGAYFLFSGK